MAVFCLALLTAGAFSPAAVGQTATTTTLAVTSGGHAVTSVPSGTLVTLTATVSAGGAVATTGQVNFCVSTAKTCTDIRLLGSAQLTSAGKATITLHPVSGQQSYKAIFVGTPHGFNVLVASSSAAASLNVVGSTTTAIAESSPYLGDNTMTATVTASKMPTAPTGTVSFVDTSNSNAVVGSAALGQSTFSLSFNSPAVPATGDEPNSVAVGDFNGDGNLDLAVADGSGPVTIALGNGDGTFTPTATSLTTDRYGQSVAVGDFNGDGKLDLAVATFNDVEIFLGNGDGTFTLAATSAVDLATYIVVGDFNGDGKPDLAVLSSSTNILTVVLGNGDGSFTSVSTTIQEPSYAHSAIVGDFNHDGNLDLAVLCEPNGQISILLGKGDGTFTTGANVQPTFATTGTMAAGDFNGDGKLDLALSNTAESDTSEPIVIMLGNGDGTFTEAASNPAGSPLVHALAVGDFNNDGIPDLAAVINNNVTILLGKGDGTFVTAGISPAAPEATFLVLGDFNGDGMPDLAVANDQANNSVVIFTTNSLNVVTAVASPVLVPGTGTHLIEASYPGNSSFQPSVSSTVAVTAATPAAAPVFTPGAGAYTAAQSVKITSASSGVSIYYTLDGTLPTPNSKLYTGPISVATAETFNAAAFGGGFGESTVVSAAYTVTLPTAATTLALTAGGSPATTVTQGTPVTMTATVTDGTTPVTTGQVNFCDATAKLCTDIHLLGTAQLTSAGIATITVRPTAGQRSYKAVFLGTPYGPLMLGASSSAAKSLKVKGSTRTTITSTGYVGNYTMTATVTGSSLPSGPTGAVSFLDTSNSNAVLGSASLGTAALGLTFNSLTGPAINALTGSMVVGDFNGDGNPDLAVANSCGSDPSCASNGSVTVLLGNGDGTFTPAATPVTGIRPYGVAAGDFNGDGKLDLAVTNSVSNTVTILLGKGDGTFTATAASPATGFEPTSMAVGDFNNDGKLDLAVMAICGSDSTCKSGGSVTILLGNGDGTFTPTSQSSAVNTPQFLATGDFNHDGKLDLVVVEQCVAPQQCATGELTILLGNGDGTFSVTANSPVTGDDPRSVVVGDFNLDGKLDLAVTDLCGYSTSCQAGGNTRILLGNGDGTFGYASTSSNQLSPEFVLEGDFNSDGIVDLVTTNLCFYPTCQGSESISLLLGNGDGTFSSINDLSDSESEAITIGDFNGDGTPDLAFTGAGPNLAIITSSSTQTATATATGIAIPGTGSHQIEGKYAGDSNYAASVSPTVPVTAANPAAEPIFTPGTGTYAQGQAVKITSTSSAASIFYTTDGTTPTPASTLYSGPITIASSETVRALAYANGYGESPIGSATYTVAAALAVMSTPAPSSTLTGSSVTFTWTTGAGVTAYLIHAGTTGAGSSNVVSTATLHTTSTTITGIPTAGATLYVRLYSYIGSAWQYNDYTYTEFGTAAPAPAVMSTPAPSSKLTGSSATFTWTTGTSVADYLLHVGTTGAGSSNIANSGTLKTTSTTVTGIPITGGTLYVRLYSYINSAWQYNDYTYVEQ